MGNPCEQAEVINDLKESTIRMEESVTRMVTEFSALSRSLQDSLLDGRETRTRLERIQSDINIAFSEIRSLREDHKIELAPIKTWQDQFQGALSATKAVSFVCMIMSTLAAMIALLK